MSIITYLLLMSVKLIKGLALCIKPFFITLKGFFIICVEIQNYHMLKTGLNTIWTNEKDKLERRIRDHPFKTSACLRGEGCPHVPMVERSQYMTKN